MDSLSLRFEKEASCFDAISRERRGNNQIPDLRKNFINEYFYNNIWRNSLFLQEEYHPISRWIINSLKDAEVSHVIDVGCGNGFLSLEMAREGVAVTGLDISPESIKIAQDYLDGLEEKEDLRLKYLCKKFHRLSRLRGGNCCLLWILAPSSWRITGKSHQNFG